MKPEKCRRILNGIASLSIGIVFLSNIPVLNFNTNKIIACATFLMISDLIFGFIFLRCPYCKKLLNFRWSSQIICHNCGKRLDENNSKS